MKSPVTLALTLAGIFFGASVVLAQAKEANKDPAAPRRISSWTADRREYQVGDVITVLVSEATIATATKSQNGSDQQTRKNGMAIEPPKIGTTTLPSLDGSMSMNKNAQSSQSGDAKRNVSFRGDISVRVVAVDKNGLIQIKGTKTVDADKNKQTLNLSGWVRPEDITPQNFVASERVADAQITYALSGDLGKTRGGLVGRILNVFWP